MHDSVRGSANRKNHGGSREVYPNLVDLLLDRVVDPGERSRKSVVVVLFVAGAKLGILVGCWAGIIEFDACICTVAGVPWQWQAQVHNKDAVQPCQNSGFPAHTMRARHTVVCGRPMLNLLLTVVEQDWYYRPCAMVW